MDYSFSGAVRKAAAKWADGLIDLDGKNTLLYFKKGAPATLDLNGADPPALTALFHGKPTRLSVLFRDSARRDAMCARARTLRKKIITLDEEQGIETGRLARGLVHVMHSSRNSRVVPLRAPLLLQSFSLRTRTESDFILKISEEVTLNPVLMYALDRLFGVESTHLSEKITALLTEAASHEDQVQQVYRMLEEALQPYGHTPRLETLLLAGVFSYDKLPMVQELHTCGQLLADHPVIAALAGDSQALQQLHDRPAPEPASAPTDSVRPENEFLVCDADPTQQRAISMALAGHHLVIDGPPGTGKSQTIANIIASMAAQGRRVLFVAEKRAAIEAVTDRLKATDLGNLVFDLHDQRIRHRQVAQQINQALENAKQEPPYDLADLHARLSRHHATAVRHDNEMHSLRPPWGISFYQALNQLHALSAGLVSNVHLSASALRKVDIRLISDLEDDLRRYVDLGGHQILLGKSPWSRSRVRDSEALRDLLTQLERLSPSRILALHNRICALAENAGIHPPATLGDWRDLLHLLDDVAGTLTVFGPTIFDEDLTDLYHATADWTWRAEHPTGMGIWRRLFLRWHARRLAIGNPRTRKVLHSYLRAALAQRERWYERSIRGTLPAELAGRVSAHESYSEFLRDLESVDQHTALVRFFPHHTPAEVAATMATLHAERGMLHRMPEINQLADRFHALGLQQLLKELAERNTDADCSADMLRHVWLTSFIEYVQVESDHLRGFIGETHSKVITRYQHADAEHLQTTANRIRRKVAERIRQVGDDKREQMRTVREQAIRTRGHMPVRRLIEKAPDVLLSAFPCWAMSPIVVSRTLPSKRLFDAVIFDEASQITPQDAITSIMRGTQIILAGDEHQLPPSDFFKRVLAESIDDNTADHKDSGDEDRDDEDGLTDYESILTRLIALIPARAQLSWHYRSLDERLIAFSNAEIYKGRLTTFPGTLSDPPITYLTVPHAYTTVGQSGSSSEEVDAVVRLVLDHAEKRNDLTMGVITLGSTHARRIEQALRIAQRDRPDLAEFFSEDKSPGTRFFVKNLETVQGDERDVIILSIGRAPVKGHQLPLKFGVLNRKDGHRRLNVAITRARRRMIVVGAFHPFDLDPARTSAARHTSIEILRKFLIFALNGGTSEGSASGHKLNEFERSVLNTLKKRNLPVHPQWGSGGYRIDFALSHPTQHGRMVLAVETDGEQYHLTLGARARDRLRQTHLERLGWQFHRIWSADWLRDPLGQTEAVVTAWRAAVAAADTPLEPPTSTEQNVDQGTNPHSRRGQRPPHEPRKNIGDYTDAELIALCLWVLSDALQIGREDRIREVASELGFQRVGRAIRDRLEAALERAQHIIDTQGGHEHAGT
ncbi:AAA domain-containing protein [Streptosporangium sp. NPDC049046]|uniref:AAA domain-containing protein n=1 Tax=Streptosporangium sp. NPDC049046 TaxID=3155031 RepID=UPI0034449D68